MKKILLILLCFSVAIAGCKKKYTCSYNVQYFSSSIAFVGFSSTELKKVVVTQYKANTNFSEVLDVDTIDASGAFMESDTAYFSANAYHHTGFFNANIGVDYKISMLSTGNEFRISEIVDGPSTISWEQVEHCSPGSSQGRIFSHQMTITGGSYVLGQAEVNNYFLYLHR